jgi:hypothetical protein
MRAVRTANTNMSETLLLLLTAAAVWFVFDALRAREAAIGIARRACREQGLQLLDDTVQGARLRLARDKEGVARVRRTFVFEFSEDGFARRTGSLVMLGAQVESLQLEPYRVS